MKISKKTKYFVYIISILVLTAIDQLIKGIIVNDLDRYKCLKFIPKILSIEYLENRGVAFGIFSGRLGLITIVVVIIVFVILYLLYSLEKTINAYPQYAKKYVFLQCIGILLIAGAIGNLIDRIRLGYVIDYIKVEFINFPTFNLADCYVTIAAFILFIY